MRDTRRQSGNVTCFTCFILQWYRLTLFYPRLPFVSFSFIRDRVNLTPECVAYFDPRSLARSVHTHATVYHCIAKHAFSNTLCMNQLTLNAPQSQSPIFRSPHCIGLLMAFAAHPSATLPRQTQAQKQKGAQALMQTRKRRPAPSRRQ